MLITALVLAAAYSAATPKEEANALLAEIDAILARGGAKRESLNEKAMCGPFRRDRTEPGTENRDFLCDPTTTATVANNALVRLRADGGTRVSASLEIRRFVSPKAALDVKAAAMERYGSGAPIFVTDGAISWCFLDVLWTEQLLIALKYGCWISIRHVRTLAEIRALLLTRAVAVHPGGPVGIAGTHSGWTFTIDAKGERLKVANHLRFSRFARVVGVAANDVLWIRRNAGVASSEELDSLEPDTECVPILWTPAQGGWMRVAGVKAEGWASRRFLREQSAEECR